MAATSPSMYAESMSQDRRRSSSPSPSPPHHDPSATLADPPIAFIPRIKCWSTREQHCSPSLSTSLTTTDQFGGDISSSRAPPLSHSSPPPSPSPKAVSPAADKETADGDDDTASAGGYKCAFVLCACRQPMWKMIRHAHYHHPVKRYSCDCCDYGSNVVSNVASHQASQHSHRLHGRPINMANAEMQTEWLELVKRCFPIPFRPFVE